jgi:predicted NBD/HSP70 family sugar kinase
MIAAGIDLGGTKIEVQLFDADWQVVDCKRIPTPQDYAALVAAVAEQIAWADARAGGAIPIGLGFPGLTDRNTGLALTANLPTTGKPFLTDINAACGRVITCVNDCRALALSEAVFGFGKGYRTVLSLILGTGVGGGIAVNETLWAGPNDIAGEFGHTPLPAHLVKQFDLPVVRCGCGRTGCAETLIAGPGLSRLAKSLTGRDISPPELVKLRAGDPALQRVWDIWAMLTAELLHSLILSVDPDVIVLGGGLSQVDGVATALQSALRTTQLAALSQTPILCAQGGDASGARGAAFAAFHEAHND